VYAWPAEWESKWEQIEQRKWKSILGGGLIWSVVMKKQRGHKDRERERERERGHLPASANSHPAHYHTLRHMTNYIREGGRRGTAQRALALPWTDTHLTHTHTYTHTHTHTHTHTSTYTHTYTHYCTGSQSAFHCTLLAARTSLCLVKKKQQTNRLTNKRT